jgi:hypothetical protein
MSSTMIQTMLGRGSACGVAAWTLDISDSNQESKRTWGFLIRMLTPVLTPTNRMVLGLQDNPGRPSPSCPPIVACYSIHKIVYRASPLRIPSIAMRDWCAKEQNSMDTALCQRELQDLSRHPAMPIIVEQHRKTDPTAGFVASDGSHPLFSSFLDLPTTVWSNWLRQQVTAIDFQNSNQLIVLLNCIRAKVFVIRSHIFIRRQSLVFGYDKV